ncbi:uncharacterized protein LOC116930070 [Daphnia magna]|uniref:uncharacterized protein LOC116930070 n=1 Tax=Daphnia magna TaxID=35525 RepID=UPI001E1BD555|nr:uncharacterized protein LOC116930070 [Daphnia magna]
MDGTILSIAVLLVTLLAILLGSNAQKQSLAPENRTRLIRSSIPYASDGRSWTAKLFSRGITPKSSRRNSKDDGAQRRLSKLTKKMKKWLKKKEKKATGEEFNPNIVVLPTDDATPFFQQMMPVNGSIPDDGCDSNSVRFANDRNCYPVLGRGPCNDPKQWVTVDPYTFKGRCTPRLCGRERVFVVRDGLCHDIYDPIECQGGRRLYYSPYGDPICDCPIGHYPFPNPQDDCVPLFTQGPCPYRYVLTIDSAGSLSCTPSQCPELPATVYGDGAIYGHSRQVQWVPTKNGVCYELGTSGPCSSYESQGQLLGYDVLKRQLECVDITNSTSPYFSSCEEKDLLDSVYDQFHPEYDVFRIWLAYQSLHLEEAVKYGKKKKNKKTIKGGGYERRQQGTLGAIQFPSSNIPLLNPTRTGTGQGKGTNPIVPDRNRREVQQVVKPGSATNCQGRQVFNAATGQCRNAF